MEGVKNAKIIEIKYGHEHRILVDDNIYDRQKFFYPVYRQSMQLVNEIHSYQKCKCIGDDPNSSVKDTILNSYPNNLIMYCADRGSGKSSAMLSFGNALNNIHQASEKKKSGYSDFWGDLTNCSFSVLDAIDPTTLCEKEAIMTIILSRLFLAMRQEMKLRDKDERRNTDEYGSSFDSSRYELIRRFRKCYKFVNVINGSTKEKEYSEEEGDGSLEELASLGDSSMLKEEFHELVKLYLQNKYETKKIDDKYLVIQIDDADLNTRMSYDIIEDIRKYCIVPNVIILMAVNMNQMHHVIEQYFTNEYSSLLQLEGFIGSDDIKQMTVKYVNKVMPVSHQINLPQIDNFIKNGSLQLTVKYIKPGSEKDMEYRDMLRYYDNGEPDQIMDYQERILRLIYRKTGVAMVKPDSYTHNFMPQKMRELTHFLSFMCSLPDLKQDLNYAEMFALLYFEGERKEIHGHTRQDAEEELIKRQNNLEAFLQYFLKSWCDNNLSKEDNRFMQQLAEAASTLDVGIADKFCCELIEEEVNPHIEPPLSANSFSLLMRKINQLPLVDTGDIRFTMERYKLAYALHLYFSLFLHREMLESIRERSFRRFRKVVGCELWTPDFSMWTEYPELGRFEVDYPAYLSLDGQDEKSGILPLIRSDSNALESMCYINISGKSYYIDEGDRKVSNALPKLANRQKCNARIIFDLGFALLKKVTTESNYGRRDISELNVLMFILFNWDVIHFVEKNIPYNYESTRRRRPRNNDPLSRIEWDDKFYSVLFSAVEKLNSYLPVNPNDSVSAMTDLVSDSNVYYTNADNLVMYVNITLSKMREELCPVIPEDSDINEKSNLVLEILTRVIPSIQNIGSVYFQNIRKFSRTIDSILRRIGRLKTAFDEVRDLLRDNNERLIRTNMEARMTQSEKINKYLDENYGRLIRSYSLIKDMLDDDKIQTSIETEIKDWFQKGKKGGDK